MQTLHIGPRECSARLIIFDKDGTLIDFHCMWATWLSDLAPRLERAAGVPLAAALYQALDFDPRTQHVAPQGRLALLPMGELRGVSAEVIVAAGLSPATAERILATHWRPPDPLTLARPLADLAQLFGALHARGIAIALATSDDRAPTELLLQSLGLTPFVSAVICADDHLSIKPAADMVLHLCGLLGIAPSDVVVVGDSVDDLRMGRAAGVGLTVGVLSGLASADALQPFADAIIPSVAALLPA